MPFDLSFDDRDDDSILNNCVGCLFASVAVPRNGYRIFISDLRTPDEDACFSE